MTKRQSDPDPPLVVDLNRITQPTLDVLYVLSQAEGFELHGWEIIKQTKRSGPTVYKILERLTAGGWLTARWEHEHPEPGLPRRRFYQLTPTARVKAVALLAERRKSFAGSWRPALGDGGAR